MKRSEPLKSTTPMVRKTPMPRSGISRNAGPKQSPAKPKAQRDTGPSKAVAIACLERDEYACFRCGGALWGERGFDFSIQHRRARGNGGSRRPDTNQYQNLIGLCGSAGGCNGWVESRRVAAREGGWAIRQSDDPLLVPVLHHDRGYIFLFADGGWGSRPQVTS
jgi:hypothetical protein